MKSIIKTESLTKVYNGKVLAVNHVNLEVEEGEIFGFLGPNGAGKTTTIKMLATLLKPTDGEALVAGFDVLKESNEVRKRIGIVFQDPALDSELTGRENLDFHARLYGLARSQRKKRISEVLELVDLVDKADTLVKNYSGGMRRRLEIARGLMHYPKVLFLDEPTLGLDPQTRRAIWDYIRKLNVEEEVTIFLTTHYMEEADYLCERVAIIDHGEILVTDKPSKLKRSIGRDLISICCLNSPRFLSALKEAEWIESLKIHNETITLGVRESEGKLPLLIGLALKNNVKIKSIDIRKPTLEDVFLYYTGRRIREEEVKGIDQFKVSRRFRRR